MTTEPRDKVYDSFQDWAAIRKSVIEAHEKHTLEWRKGSLEFGKLICTNLHLINAGGMVAMPAFAQLLGFAQRTSERLYLIGTPFAIFTAGLVLAILCAVAGYYNYLWLAEHSQDNQNLELLTQEVALPSARREDRTQYREEEIKRLRESIGKFEKLTRRSYLFAHVVGWLSLAAFISACGFLAAHV